jgi:hypothetical protein
MSIAEIHARLGNTALYYLLIMGLWALWRYFRKQGMDSNYWGALVIGEVLILLQSGIGAYMWLVGLRPGRGIHILYGIVALLIIPGLYLYTKGDDKRPVMLIYGIALLIGVGVLLRAIMTAAGVPG